ncbi:MAG TPA: hypothetical protein VFT22_26860 [Kofleriaceae bacterium]|nr:hypothetical protein [Kofleriaceae bacterium]
MAVPSGPIDLGHDAELSSCGACVYFWDCFGCGPADSPRYYFAASGTLTVLELGGKDDKLRITLTDVVLRHVTADGTAALTDAADLCKFTLAEAGINTGFFYASGDFVPRRLPLPDER